MAEPLRVGLAGLGTVGSAVAAMIMRSRTALAERAGRPIELVAYASKDPPKDPSLDLKGVRKIDSSIELARADGLDVFVELMGGEGDTEAVHVEGIESISLDDLEAADELGYRVKLLGVAQRTNAGIEQRVHPTMVRKGTVIAGVDGVTNAVAIDADTMELTLMGPGAGGAATASAVVADLMDLAAGRRVPSFGRPAARLVKPQRAPMQRHEGGYYIRLAAVDRPGTAATI